MLRVARLSIAPVRALGLQHPDAIELTESGVLEDRRFFLVDEHGRILDRLRAGALVRVQARTNPRADWLRLDFPDGSTVEGDVEPGEPIEVAVYSRIAIGHVVSGPWTAALEPFAHRAVRLVRCDSPGGTRIRPGETQVRNAVSLVSDGSLRELARQLDVSAVDARRFRMLIEIEGATPHEEDGWIGGQLEVGTAVLTITKPDARCAITTQDPDTGHPDLDTLRTILRYRGFRAAEGEHKLDFGVLGDVLAPGRVSVGDSITVVDRVDAPAADVRAAAPA